LPRYFAEIAYKGSRYHGWQIQPNALTVQEVINEKLGLYLKLPTIETVGCGRTDTGVHASQFYFHFDLNFEIAEEICAHRLNAMLPNDIVVYSIFKVADHAHARFDATARTYHFHLHTQRDPFINDTSLYFPATLDIEMMNEAARLLLNYEDFGSFCKGNSDNFTNLCTLTKAEFMVSGHQIKFIITANRFLRNMVRSIVGTLLLVGTRKITLNEFIRIVEAKNRSKAGKSVDGRGLFLTDVEYPYI
jgi:tRNA pseudouridine38-40 synthase